MHMSTQRLINDCAEHQIQSAGRGAGAQGRKAPGRSGSRSSNISKASNSTAGPATASRTSITPSSQDICSGSSSSQLTRVEEDVSESQKPEKPTHSSVMSVTNTTLGAAPKKQVKRRHRRKKSSCSPDSVETNGKTEHSECSLSAECSELGEKKERTAKTRRELPPRLRTTGGPPSDSTSEEEAGREDRSWSKEKARRVRRRSGSSRERDGANEGKEEEEDKVMELQSVCSEEGKESLPLAEERAGLKKRSNRASVKRDEHASQRGGSQSREKEKSSKSDSSSGSSSLSADGEELINKRYQEKGAGGGDMSVPTPQNHCAMNGSTQYSDDSDTDVCRICHCEGDDECALITPCRCTGSLSFVHQFCLNQWIRSSDTRCCELCKFDFVMETTLKPLCTWERLNMSTGERRKIFFSVVFHLLAVTCILLSVFVLVMRTSEEIKIGRNGE
ncbi:uncharacterized protein marchf1, partial [Notothenia coriiceps]|uniref:Uncharacterized protein marchf1 n=1 Tax=Notothenia coriiceps TaxID=8208 RepID=A0A6I9MTK2_9TELE